MKLHTINTGFFKLDGGAMFGVVPKTLWASLNPPDAQNMCSWAMRCLLVEDGDSLILIDNGIGNKQDDKFFSRYHLHGIDSLDTSLAKLGFDKSDITDVFLSHLHFDHCGGSVVWNDKKTALEPAFKNAHYWSNEQHWKLATQPNPREKASFLKENILPIQESGQLRFLNEGQAFKHNIDVFFSSGHTDAMMHPLINVKGKKVAFMADLLPSSHHVPMPYVMAYDTKPLVTMEEKEKVFTQAVQEEWILFLEHDKDHACCTLEKTEKGFKVKDRFALSDFFTS